MKEPLWVPYKGRYEHTPVWPEGVPFPVEIRDGESRFKLEHGGGFHAPIRKITGLAISHDFERLSDERCLSYKSGPREKRHDGITVYGVRSMNAPRESGYNMEGRVSVGGKTIRAFTSSQLFWVEGKLVDVAVLFVCVHSPRDKQEDDK